MNCRLLVLITLTAIALASCKMLSGPRMGETVESFETSNQTFRMRVDRHAEVGGFMAVLNGAYYVFRSAPVGSDNWHHIMTFRHDDPNPIQRGQVRFVSERELGRNYERG